MQTSDRTIIYIAVSVFFSEFLFLIITFLAYKKIVKKYFALSQDNLKGIDAEALLVRAHLRSQKILEDASLKSREIIENTQSFLKKEQLELEQELQKARQIYVKKYEESLSLLQKQSLGVLQNLPNDLKIFMVSAVDSFRASLAQDVAKTQAQIAAQLSESLVAAQHEIDKYKEDRKRRIDEESLEIVTKIAKKVLAKDISIEEHEKLVMKALEEAKRQGVF